MTTPVLICRPGERGEALTSALREQGATVAQLNVMQLEALPEDTTQRSIWMDIDQYHKIVVVSPFAAYCLSEAMDCYWPQLPIGIDYYSVGRATANALFDKLGVRVQLPPPESGEDTSEALLSLASLKSLKNQRILLVAGVGGRTLLADALETRGARVTRVAVYRRIYQPPSLGMQQRLASGDYRALIATSGELLEYLAKWCGKEALNQPLIVSSHRLATLAGKLGFSDLKVASGATPAALVAALGRSFNPRGADVDQGT